MLVGADTVQVCSAVMENGYGIIKKFCEGLQGYLERKGMNSPTDLVGRSLPYFTEHKNLNRSRRIFAAVEQITCHRCGKCVTSCCDSGYQAIRLEENGFRLWTPQAVMVADLVYRFASLEVWRW